MIGYLSLAPFMYTYMKGSEREGEAEGERQWETGGGGAGTAEYYIILYYIILYRIVLFSINSMISIVT